MYQLLQTTVARLLAQVMLALLLTVSACACSGGDDGTDPRPAADLPELELRDDTPDLLLTWVDDRGRTHTEIAIADVPEAGRGAVRVVTEKLGHGTLFYVADLSHKKADGTYPVRVMRRSEWEGDIEKRRSAYAAKHAPAPPAATASPDTPKADAGKVVAVVYGASWCGPCHQAKAYLEKRGVKVIYRDIEKKPAYQKEMLQKLARAGHARTSSIPIIDVAGTILVGFSTAAVDRAIARAKGSSHL